MANRGKKSKGNKTKSEKHELGVTAEKDDFSEWFTELMIKTELADYTKVSGCMAFRPRAWGMWEKIVEEVNKRLKKIGIKNVYFPIFIPESLLIKEKEHIKGFSPEVAWVTQVGDSKLGERLAIRPTSEAIMYDSFSKWIRSWRDLPLRYNQWSNVVRWEFRHPVPFLRTREFVFNEGHTVFANQKEAEDEEKEIIRMYSDICENYLALPSLIGRKSEKEKFAGAVYTISMEFLMPNGKTVQGPDFHHDGQNFAKAYEIKFLDEKGKEKYAWQNTWAISTRMLGIMYAIHSDKNGLVIPPKMADNKAVIVPIIFNENKKKVLKKSKEIKEILKDYNVILDDREEHTAGFKFNEWEMKGIPLRIEVGPKDIEKKEVVIARRDNGKKESVKVDKLHKRINELLEDIQKNLFEKAKKLLKEGVKEVKTKEEIIKCIKDKKIALAPLCRNRECEDNLKFESEGAKVLNIDDAKSKKIKNEKCVICNNKADYFGRVGKSY